MTSRKQVYGMAVVWTLTMAAAAALGVLNGTSMAGVLIACSSVWFHVGRLTRMPFNCMLDPRPDEPEAPQARKWGRQP